MVDPGFPLGRTPPPMFRRRTGGGPRSGRTAGPLSPWRRGMTPGSPTSPYCASATSAVFTRFETFMTLTERLVRTALVVFMSVWPVLPTSLIANRAVRVARPPLEGRRGLLELDELELQPPVAGGREPHRVDRSAPALGRRARVEDVEALALLVQREVRVAEHDRVGVREAPPQPREPSVRRPAVVGH